MSQREEEEEATSPGDSAAAGDPIGNVVTEESVSEEPITTTGNEVETVADSEVTDEGVGVENGVDEAGDNVPQEQGVRDDFEPGIGDFQEATVEVSREVSQDVEEEEFDPRIGEESAGVKEAAMAEALINGLHHVDEGGGGGPTGERDQHKIEASAQLSEFQLADRGVGKVGSPQKGADNGPGATVEHHRKLPLSGSQNLRPSDGPEGYPSRPPSGKNLVGDVLSSFASDDEEGRSRQRILAFAAKRYSTAVEQNPDDHDALYNWALVLQESADNTAPEAGNSAKDSLLEEACRKYEAATELCPTLHEAFYNWAIAISDRAKIRGRTKEAEDLWKQACERYDKSVQLNWNSPQALNNWGLALQELGAIVPLKEKRAIVKKAIRKFRSAIRLRFDFHRAVYNLGTVLYGLAEDTVRGGRKLSVREPTPPDLYSQSAIYIAAAHALKPDYPVYRSALRLVRPMLPLPFVKAGYLTVPPLGDTLAPHNDWQRLWFVLNHEALYEMERLDRKGAPGSASRRSSGTAEGSSSSVSFKQPVLRIEMEDIVFMTSSADLSLPSGGGFRIDTTTGHQFLIADTWEAMDGWVDAIRLVYTIFARGKRDSLAGVLAG